MDPAKKEALKELRNFIDSEMGSVDVVEGHVISLDPSSQAITAELSESCRIKSGSMVLVNNVVGIVQEQYGSSLKIKLNKDTHDFKGADVLIDSSLRDINLKRIDRAVRRIEEGDLDEDSMRILKFVSGEGKPSYKDPEHDISDRLNSSQEEAVNFSLSANDFHLILGPPGTGKTHVIKEMITEMLKNGQKVLATAYTNRAVDNVLEKLGDVDEEIVLRIGSYTEISPESRRYSLDERRKKHPDWGEVDHLTSILNAAFQDMEDTSREIKEAEKGIKETLSRKKPYEEAIKNIGITIKKYRNIAADFKPETGSTTKNIDSIKKQRDDLEREVKKYYSLTRSIFQLEKIEESLPSAEEFYDLEAQIEKMEKRKFLKRILSIFNRAGYEDFINDLEDKKSSYQLMVESYNAYWDLRDATEERYRSQYPDLNGKPDEDTIKYQKELLHVLNDYLPLKKEYIQQKHENEKKLLIYDSYMQYIASLVESQNLLKYEVKYLKTELDLRTKSRTKLFEKRENIKKTIEKYENDKKRIITSIERDLISRSQLILSTVLSSAHYLLNDEVFDVLIMDEASQVSSYVSLLPLLKCKKFILVGDNNQLQPIKEPKLSQKWNTSIFNRMIQEYPSNYSFLDTQYRMNREIADVASQMFYNGKIKTYPPIAQQTINCEGHALNSNNPLTFIDTANAEYYEEGIGRGCENCKEARTVVHLVDLLLENRVDPAEIGIITPYKKQKALIKRYLSESRVEVDTVYRFQGKEKDVIIMSFCKSKLGRIGKFSKEFIADPNQLNVSITRARKKLIIIGDSRTLRQSQLLSKLLEMVGKENTVKPQ